MDLNEYIRQSYKRPNRRILETLRASEELIEYLMETPWNTNWKIVETISRSGGSTGEKIIHLTPIEVEYEGETFPSIGCMDCGDAWDEIVEATNTEGMVPIAYGEGYVSEGGESAQIDGQLFKIVSSDYPWRFPCMVGDRSGSAFIVDMRELVPDAPYALVVAGEDGDLTIRYKIVEGYKITLQRENKYIGTIVNIHYIEKNETFEFDESLIGTYCATDGTNTYQAGDIITPTSDITFTIVECE